MRPIYGCPEKFQESLATVTATFPEIVNGHLLRSIVLKCIPNLKFVALLAPKIVGTKKIWQCLYIRPRSLSLKILMGKNQRQNTGIAAGIVLSVSPISKNRRVWSASGRQHA